MCLVGEAWKGRVEVCVMGCVVRTVFGKSWEGRKNMAVGEREGAECLCLVQVSC